MRMVLLNKDFFQRFSRKYFSTLLATYKLITPNECHEALEEPSRKLRSRKERSSKSSLSFSHAPFMEKKSSRCSSAVIQAHEPVSDSKNKLTNGCERGLKLKKKILGVNQCQGGMVHLVKWTGTDEADNVRGKLLKQHHPEKLVELKRNLVLKNAWE